MVFTVTSAGFGVEALVSGLAENALASLVVLGIALIRVDASRKVRAGSPRAAFGGFAQALPAIAQFGTGLRLFVG